MASILEVGVASLILEVGVDGAWHLLTLSFPMARNTEEEPVNGYPANGHRVSTGSPAAKRSRQDLLSGVEEGGHWVVKASRQSHDCINPVRSCEEKYFKEPMERRNKSKKLIKLSIGMT